MRSQFHHTAYQVRASVSRLVLVERNDRDDDRDFNFFLSRAMEMQRDTWRTRLDTAIANIPNCRDESFSSRFSRRLCDRLLMSSSVELCSFRWVSPPDLSVGVCRCGRLDDCEHVS